MQSIITRVVVALRDPAQVGEYRALARRLGHATATVAIRGLVPIPAQRSLSEGALMARQWREAFEALEDASRAECEVVVEHEPLAV